MEFYKARPCKTCRMRECKEMDCQRWQQWYLNSWEAMHRYAWEQMDQLGRQEARCFRYELPHVRSSPCEKCVCKAWCDTPCARRVNWWDDRIGGIRRKYAQG